MVYALLRAMCKWIIMRYIDKYPDCIGCPVYKYCGTMIGSIRLCNSYEQNKNNQEHEQNFS